MADQSVRMVTAIVLHSVFFLSGDSATCDVHSDLFITAPKEMEALTGSCLRIPCNFRVKQGKEFNSKTTPFGVWIKNDSRFDSPPKPRIEISGDVKEKESVSISCSASTPCPHSPPQLTWNLQPDSHHMMEENTDGTFTTRIQKSITLSHEHDGFIISCSARYPVNEGKDVKTSEERKTLSVSYAPKNTSVSISPSGRVSAGSWVNLTCSSRAKPPVSRFTWFKTSRDAPIKVSEGDFYSFNVTDGGVYYCVATNQLGDQTSSEIHLTIGGDQLVGAQVIVKVLGIILLVTTLLIFECWLKSRRCTKPQESRVSSNAVKHVSK
uniref:Ig-like domain-containing protein n=1 Tax=Gasterosteus aculeatus aculeatus TaxID=481459 RepID=A0AAQ4Q9S3_GASAC